MTCTALCGHSAVCHTTHTHVSHFRGRELVLRPLPRPSRALRRKPSRRCAHASAFAGALAAPSSDPVGSIRGLINMASAAALIVAAWWYLSSAQVCSCLAHHLAACAACVHHSSACRLTFKPSSNFKGGACLPHVSPHSVVVTKTYSARSKCCSHAGAPQPFLLAYLSWPAAAGLCRSTSWGLIQCFLAAAASAQHTCSSNSKTPHLNG